MTSNTDLLNNVAHELRTPITNLSLVSQMIGDKSIPNESKDFERLSTMIADESKRLNQQVDKFVVLFEELNTKRALTIDEVNADVKEIAAPKFLSTVVDLSVEVAEPVPVLKQGEYVIFSRGNISTIGGKAKSRKTFLIVLYAADFLENNDTGKVLVIDTEMAKAHTYKTARRIHRLMGWESDRNNDRLTVLSLREYAPTDRAEIFKEAIEHFRPELVFLDGVRDLVKDFNSVEESTQTVGMLMKLSTDYDCHICSILHENKGNGQLRGHLGTEVINKSESVLSVTNNGEASTVEPVYTRNMPFDTFTFRINDDGLPEYCDMPVKPAKTDELRQLFEGIIKDDVVSYSGLKTLLIDGGIKKATAERRIKLATDAGIIIKNQRGDYYIPKVNSESETSLPF